ncbi:hypothetical protein AcW2_000919 [Taiwanofungus camphoratus]|nr:hypothetical protein AcW2_000919 [Antrodia cinnamomea]
MGTTTSCRQSSSLNCARLLGGGLALPSIETIRVILGITAVWDMFVLKVLVAPSPNKDGANSLVRTCTLGQASLEKIVSLRTV